MRSAPGVAFKYNYEFNLADERISATQEAHAVACEKVGMARCRITGMGYTVDENEQVTASLSLKLEPSIARQFGKSAQRLVQGNDGKLIRLDIGTSNEGDAVAQASRRNSDLTNQIAEVQQQLARTKPGTDAHASLVGQLQVLRQQSSEQSRSIEAGQAALATTPMDFHYYGRGGVPGFRGNPLREAWQTFIGTIVRLVGLLLQALAVLVPLGMLAALSIALWRTRPVRALRAWIRGPQDSEL
jgi:hypothetical protein